MNGSGISAATDEIQKTETDTTTTKFSSGAKPGMPGGNQSSSSTTTTTHSEKITTLATNGDFSVVGYSTLDGMSDFISGNYTITDGEISTDFNSYSCVISQELATLNNLSVGNTITLVNPNNTKKTYELTITGIYTDNTEESNTMDKMYSNSANKIITNITVVNAMVSDDANLVTTITAKYILTSKDAIDAFTTEVNDKGLSDYYTVTTNLDTISEQTEAITNISNFALTFLIINLINVRERKYEIGVLRTIGMKKSLVISQFVIELVIVSFIGLILGAGVGSLCSVSVANSLLASEVDKATTDIENIAR